MKFFKESLRQLIDLWRGFNLYQQMSIALVASALIGLFVFIVFSENYSSFSPLFVNEKLQLSDTTGIKEYLNKGNIPYKLGDQGQFLVPSKDVQRARSDLAALGLSKNEEGKGFEIFDSNTWIKGEKELQIMEVRALSGRLERDLANYENVRSATVVLDIAVSRPFSTSPAQTKASVILNLAPGSDLKPSELQAITYHVASAVRGLEPNMVAISDTKGRLYQGLDPGGKYGGMRTAQLIAENDLKGKIDQMLTAIFGAGNFSSAVHVEIDSGGIAGNAVLPAKIGAISIALVINSPRIESRREIYRTQLLRQLQLLTEPYHVQTNSTVEFIGFEKGTIFPPAIPNSNWNLSFPLSIYLPLIIIGLLILGSIIGLVVYWLFAPPKKSSLKPTHFRNETSDFLSELQLEPMVSAIQKRTQTNPEAVANALKRMLKEQKS